MPAKKRRKRRKRSIPTLPLVKKRQYYEHDNRKLRNNYTAVAKKFRPLIENDMKRIAKSKNIPHNNHKHKSVVQKSSSSLVVNNALSIDSSTHANLLTLPLLLQWLNDTYCQAFAQFGAQEPHEFSNITKRVRETHQIAAAQQEKNAKLREAFNISECFVDGSSFGSYQNTKEEMSKNLALQKELDEQIGALKATAAPAFEIEKSRATTSRSEKEYDNNKSEKKKKKKRQRSRSSSTEYKSSKRKKSKKQKKERNIKQDKTS